MNHQSLNLHAIGRNYPWALLSCLMLGLTGCNWIELFSVSNSGVQGDNDSYSPVLSYNARYIAFDSRASNLVPDDSGSYIDVFRHDTVDGTTIRVSVDCAGNEGNGTSQHSAISADGRYVAFESS